MSQPVGNNVYGVANGYTSTTPFIEIFKPRAPTSNDVQYQIQQRWFDTSTDFEYILTGFTSTGGVLAAVWIVIGSVAELETITTPDGHVVFPIANNINFLQSGGINITGNDPVNSDIKFQVTGGGLPWTNVTTTTQQMASNNGYVANNASLVTLTLPASPSFGDVVAVCGKGSGGWRIAQNAGQQISCGTNSTTIGTGGSISSTNLHDCIYLLCVTANPTFVMLNSVGNLTLV